MHNVKFYLTTQAAWDAIYDDCSKARHSIECEQYILTDKGIGSRLLQLFAEKARQHLRIRLMFDRIGSRSLLASSRINQIVHNGGEIFFYNHLQLPHLLQPWHWFPRDHIKTILIDANIAYTGSVCFDQAMHNWRDTQVRLTGPIIRQVRDDFDYLWQRFTGNHNYHLSTQPAPRNNALRYIVSTPTLGRNAIYDEIKKALNHARFAIYLTSPFFIPDQNFMELLYSAAKRGVEIILLVSHNSDAPLADFASQSYFTALLSHGIRVFRYEHSLLHAKSIIVDDDWATIGSTNLDYLSFYYNREANLVIRDKKPIRLLTRHFFNDLKHSYEMQPERWQMRPLSQKFLEYLGRCASRIL